MRSGIGITIFLLAALAAQAQLQKRDSLLRLLTSAKEDTAKVMLLLHIADDYETNNQDSSIFYLEESKKLSDALKFKTGQYHYYAQHAIVSFTKGDYTQAMQQCNEALALAKEIGNPMFVGNTLVNTGIVYQYLGQFDKQLEASLAALQFFERAGQRKKFSGLHQNIANAYYNLNQFRKAIDYSLLSLRFHQTEGRNDYPNRIYSTLGQCYAALKNSDSALYFYKISLDESIKLNDQYASAAIYGFMADTYGERNEYKEMLAIAQRSLSLSRVLQSNQMLASSLATLANAHYYNNQTAEAKRTINEALKIATADTLKDELKNIYKILSYIASKEGDLRLSQWAMQKKDSIEYALFNEQLIKTTAELETRYETEKKNRQILLQETELQKREILNYVYLGASAIVLVIFLLSYRTYQQKQKLQQQRISELETEKKLTATEAVLKGEEQERTRLAKDLHDGLGGMLSGIKHSFSTMKGNLIMTPENHQAFERSLDMLDSSIQEMRRVAHNMMPEALVRFGLDTALKDYCHDINQTGVLKINYQSIGIENEIFNQTATIAIYRVIQELVTNIIKHASAKMAIVQLTKSNGQLSVTVEDDGKGFNTNILTRSHGAGWTNIQHRVDFLKGKLDVSSESGKGTSVHIEFNI